jgi:hypothetical protein
MKVRYFEDTDTLLIELRDAPATETRDLDENTIMDLDATLPSKDRPNQMGRKSALCRRR